MKSPRPTLKPGKLQILYCFVFFDKEVKSKNMFLVFTFFISMPMIPAQPDVLTLFFGSDPKMSNAQAEITTAA